MPSSVTLTVSNLPTSTSFFLSALQPLDYGYRGHSNNTIGFGSATKPSAPPDFWITQEVPGVPAGAAHVSFHAPSRIAVQHFFTAALKAGSNIHGEPAARHSSGYYSAAVIDFDGNSIEAVFRPGISDNKRNEVEPPVSSTTIAKASSATKTRVAEVPTSSVKSSVSRSATLSEAPAPARRASNDVTDSIVSETRSATNVARNLVQAGCDFPASQYRPSAEGSGNVLFGTVLGVAAGAALHYAFSHDKVSNSRPAACLHSITQPTTFSHCQGRNQPRASHHFGLEENDYESTVRPTSRSTTSQRHKSIQGQRMCSTGCGNATAPSSRTATKASQPSKTIEARPPSSLKGSSPSQLFGPFPHHTKAHSTAPPDISHPSKTPDSSDRHRSNNQRALPPSSSSTTTATKNTLATRAQRALRTSTSPPPPAASAVTTAIAVAPLSEANLERATANPALIQPSAPATTFTSLHAGNPKANATASSKARPFDTRSSRSRNTTRGVGSRSSGITAAAAAAENRGSQTQSQKLDAEVMPQDSISQVSSKRSSVRIGGVK